MALEILERNEKFYLIGKLNDSTFASFVLYFKLKLEEGNSVIVNIDEVNEISKSGLDAINALTEIALINHKIFSIVGKGCKEIYDDFDQINVA